MLCFVDKSTFGTDIVKKRKKALFCCPFDVLQPSQRYWPFISSVLFFLLSVRQGSYFVSTKGRGGGGCGTNSNDSKEACYFLGACLSLDKLYNLHTVQYYVHKLFSFIYKYKRISLWENLYSSPCQNCVRFLATDTCTIFIYICTSGIRFRFRGSGKLSSFSSGLWFPQNRNYNFFVQWFTC
jgi:hypothetical protein